MEETMSAPKGRRRILAQVVLVIFLSFALVGSALSAVQSTTNLDELSARAVQLIRQQKMTEALPLLEQLAIAQPSEPGPQFYLGFALSALATNTSDSAARQAIRVRSRKAFLKAKELGSEEPVLDALIAS